MASITSTVTETELTLSAHSLDEPMSMWFSGYHFHVDFILYTCSCVVAFEYLSGVTNR